MDRLAEVLGLTVEQTVSVNSISEYSTFCTSIVARDPNGLISHVRNLDFDYTTVMKQLVYQAVLRKDGEDRAFAPSIAGYYGAYTGHKPDSFSVSYNVRETVQVPTEEMIRSNLQNSLNPEYVPLWNLIQTLLLERTINFEQAVTEFSTRKVTSPGYVIVGGLHENQGVVIARDSLGTNHTHWLSEENWYVAQTNRDVWRDFGDSRYNATVTYLDQMGQAGVTLDGVQIIEEVLWREGVLQQITIFTATATANKNQNLTIYNPPNDLALF